jgi:carbon starvation protein
LEPVELVWRIVSWLFWVGLAWCLGSLFVGAALFALGRREHAQRLFAGSLAGLVLSLFGWGAVSGVIDAGEWYLYALSASLLGLGVMRFARGDLVGGSWLAVGSILVLGLGAFASSLSQGVSEISGALLVSVSASPSQGYAPLNVTLHTSISGESPPYTARIDWGDGEAVDIAIPGGNVSASHTYRAPGGYAVAVSITDSKGASATAYAPIGVQERPWWLSWPFNIMTEPIEAGLSTLSASLSAPFYMLYTSPPYPEELKRIYSSISDTALAGLGLFLTILIAWSIWSREEPGEAIAESLKDAAFVLLVAATAVPLYEATASILNTVSTQIVSNIKPAGFYAGTAALIGTGVVVGYFVPALANLSSAFVISLLIATAIAIIRYYMILAIVTAAPIIAVAWLHPGLRGAASAILSLLAGLMLSGPVAAVFIYIVFGLSQSLGIAGTAAFYLSAPIVVALAPQILTALSPGIMGVLASRAIRIAGVISPGQRSSQIQGSQGPWQSLGAQQIAIRRPAQAVPIHRALGQAVTTLRTRAEEKRSLKQQAEILYREAEEQRRISRQAEAIARTLEDREALRRAWAEEAEATIRSIDASMASQKAEAIKPGREALATLGEALKANVRQMAIHIRKSMKEHAKRELGISLGPGVSAYALKEEGRGSRPRLKIYRRALYT